MADMRRAEAAFVDQYAVCLAFEQDWCLEICLGERVKGGEIAWVFGADALYVIGQRFHVSGW